MILHIWPLDQPNQPYWMTSTGSSTHNQAIPASWVGWFEAGWGLAYLAGPYGVIVFDNCCSFISTVRLVYLLMINIQSSIVNFPFSSRLLLTLQMDWLKIFHISMLFTPKQWILTYPCPFSPAGPEAPHPIIQEGSHSFQSVYHEHWALSYHIIRGISLTKDTMVHTALTRYQ